MEKICGEIRIVNKQKSTEENLRDNKSEIILIDLENIRQRVIEDKYKIYER